MEITYLKCAAFLKVKCICIDMTWGFQMSYYSSSQLKGLQKSDLSKLEVWKEFCHTANLNVARGRVLDIFQIYNFDRS